MMDDNFVSIPGFGGMEEEPTPVPGLDYDNPIGDSSIPSHRTQMLFDASKIQQFMGCPRGYFFRYVLGWAPVYPNIHLVFGSGWHEAMEHLLNNGYSPSSIREAHRKFRAIWDEAYHFTQAPDDQAKNPNNALQALADYCATWAHDRFEVLYTEIAGTVPIREDRLIFFKLDSVIHEPGEGFWSLEHKTTGIKHQSWLDQWTIKMQVGTYLHGLHFLVPREEIRGVKINGTILRKETKGGKGNEFVRVPVTRELDMMEYWLWEVNYYVSMIEWHMEQLRSVKPEDPIMFAFPRNAESCGKWGCKYPGLCAHWANPVARCHRPPGGYKVEFWDPSHMVEEAANVVNVPSLDAENVEVQHVGRKEGIIRESLGQDL